VNVIGYGLLAVSAAACLVGIAIRLLRRPERRESTVDTTKTTTKEIRS
jgi:hypothetical protein